jgi:predicted transcriptional regulator of viral defense system
MQPIKRFASTLASLADSQHYLFTLSDLKCVIPEHSQGAFRVLLSRCVKNGLLQRICYGLYLYPPAVQDTSLLLFHAAAKLRAHCFNYLSLETVLSDAGIISQIPMNWITLMSSCRSQTIICDRYGHIEFIHTKKKPADAAEFLTYDPRCRLWRASIDLAIKDMRVTGRSTDLMELPDESV